MEDNDAQAETIGQYLALLTKKIWDEEEVFDGKRPFGNSGWQSDISLALIRAEAVSGTVDDTGWPSGYIVDEIDSLMQKVTAFLVVADWTTLALPPEPKDWAIIAFDPQTNEVVHHLDEMLDESSAKAKAESKNNAATFWTWVAIRVPK
jgi:hypothetical protein